MSDKTNLPGSRTRLFTTKILNMGWKPKGLFSFIPWVKITKGIYYVKSYISSLVEERISGGWSETPVNSGLSSGMAGDTLQPRCLEDSEVVPKDVAVSIIIPTENAGSSFHHHLTMARSQEGLKRVDIIVVDSGSHDNTLEVARSHRARILEVSSGGVSGSDSRNLGAESASGDFLFFTTQEALLPSDSFVYEMVDALQKKGVAAVSCAEFPREDADLFSSACALSHNEFLGVNRNDRILAKPEQEDHLALRKNGQLSHVACLIPRDLFLKYQYRNGYAKDLDLGLRLLRDGHKIAFLSSTKIIHPHSRPPSYYLRKGYADHLALRKMFPDFPEIFVESQSLAHDIMVSLGAINFLVSRAGEGSSFPCSTEKLLRTVMGKLQDAEQSREVPHDDTTPFIDDEMMPFLEVVGAEAGRSGKAGDRPLLLEAILKFLDSTVFDFLRKSHGSVDEDSAVEIYRAVYKSFAFQCGVHLAEYELKYPGGTLSTKSMNFGGYLQ